MKQEIKELIEKYERRISACEAEQRSYNDPSHAHTSAEQEIKTLNRVVRQLREILNRSE
jgi:predicted component of type VI protein secretion system